MPLNASEPTFERTFDDLFAELRSRIPMYNPAWTNFNDSDPGITLLQLFAYLGETLLHQMGQVPRKNYLKFAQLLGLELQPPRPAVVALTFTPKANERPATIKERSVYSAAVEGSPPLLFETKRALDVIGAVLAVTAVRADGRVIKVANTPAPNPEPFRPLGANPQEGNALYLGFKPSPSNPTPFPSRLTFLALRPAIDTAGVAKKAGDTLKDLVAPVSLVWEYRPKADRDTGLPRRNHRAMVRRHGRDGGAGTLLAGRSPHRRADRRRALDRVRHPGLPLARRPLVPVSAGDDPGVPRDRGGPGALLALQG